ncbi:gliding motility-associated C-terminal domain-containing protein [Flavobacterium sp. HTF]|uniref:gliding motility-associated C-terminal domain-containing protein n=1 Tax=Flavobacterium sp. HTF TaxID=2170732 RepID=UPI000D5EC714|nr:gliding motility-associated C-terminal domain-containing protein [Flavobacterium sp. HTF]PWB23977.1 hypothetical protein DCO46_13185 [Flavobacterium sp. HTF]
MKLIYFLIDFDVKKVLLILFLFPLYTFSQNCTVNANADRSQCPGGQLELLPDEFYLFGTANADVGADYLQNPFWTQISGNAVNITTPNLVQVLVKGASPGNTYGFRLTAQCADGSTVFDDVYITILPVTFANAGTDQTYCQGTYALNGNLPGTSETGTWTIKGPNNAGITINNPNSPNTTITVSGTSSGSSILVWTISNTSSGCTSFDEVVISTLGGVEPVTAGSDITLSNCYSATESVNLNGSFGGTVPGQQQGTWTVVSGPNIPNFSNPNTNNTNVNGLVEGTYVFRWTVAGTCANGVDDVTVTVPAPTADVTNVAGVSLYYCDGRTATTLQGTIPLYVNETVQWTQTGGPASTIVNPTSPSTLVTGMTSLGTYTFLYTLTNSVTNCVSTGTHTIVLENQIAITAGPDQELGCNVFTATIPVTSVGSGQTSWQIVSEPIVPPLLNPPYPSYPTPLVNFSGNSFDVDQLLFSGTYIVRVIKNPNPGSLCETVYDDVTIVSSAQPAGSNAGTTQNLGCNLTTAVLAGNIPTRGRGKWSQVSGPSTAVFSNVADPTTTVSSLVNGRYEFRWTISGGAACDVTQSISQVIVSNAIPSQANAGNDQSVCYGIPVKLQGNTTLSSETGTWTVSPATAITFSNVNDPNATASGLAQNTAYTFTWTIANGCDTSSDTVTVATNNSQGANADAGPDQCLPAGTATITLAANNPAPGTGSWVQTSGIAVIITNPGQYNTTVTGLSDGDYEFTWTISGVGCTDDSDTVGITIAPSITVAQAGADQSICGSTATVTANTPAAGETGLWEFVSGGDGPVITNPSNPTTTITGLTTGAWVYKWTISRGVCVSSSDSVQLNINEAPSQAIAGADQTTCNQTSVTLGATPPSIGSGIWSLISGPNSPVFSDAASAVSTLSNLITGQYILEWTTSTGLNCPESKDQVAINVTEAAAAGSDYATCLEGPLNLTGNNGSTGTWSYVSGPNTPTITSTGNNSASVTGLIPGTYVFRYTVAAQGSCPETFDDISVIINGSVATAPNAGTDQSLCGADLPVQQIQLTATPPDLGTTGEWTILSGPNVGTFSDASDPNAIYSNPGFGTYVFNWKVSSGSCSSSDQVRVVYSDAPSLANAGGDNTICGSTTTLTATTPVVGTGKWTQDSGPTTAVFSSEISPNTRVSNLTVTGGVYVFRWTVTNGTICTPTTDTVQITVTADLTTPDAGPDQTICQSLTAVSSANPITVGTGTWSQFNGPALGSFSDPANPNTVFTPNGAGTYILRWTATNLSCTFFDDMVLIVDPLPSSSNAGTPISVCQFQPVNLNGNTPTVGTGLWTQVSGATTAVFANAASPATAVFGTQAGVYVFRWTISSGTCVPSSSDVTVTINQLPPLADAGTDQTICNTSVTTLSGNNPSSGTGTWTFVLNAGNTAVITNPNLYNTTVTGISAGQTRLKWTISSGSCAPYSDEVNIQKPSNLITSALTSDTTICQGGTLTLTTTPSGSLTPYSYQWQSSPNGVSGWTNISGQTGASYTTDSNLTIGDYFYRVNVFNSCTQITSNVAKLTIIADPLVTLQPIGNTICSGGTHTMTVAATTTNLSAGTLNYQWQSSVDGISNWVNVSGGTGAGTTNYTTAALTSNLYFRARISQTGSGCEIFSNSALVNVTIITAQPVNPSPICVGGIVNITIAASLNGGSGSLSYQWQSNSGSGFVNETNASANTPNFTSDPLTGNTNFRCLVTSSVTNCILTSNVVTATVVPDPAITVQPANGTVCVGGSHTLNVVATGGVPGLIYQWYSGPDGSNFAPISGATSSTYTTPALNSTTFYRVEVSAAGNGCGSVTSNNALVVVDPDPVVNQQPVGNTICSGNTHIMSVIASGNAVFPLSYQWQSSINGSTGWSNVTGGTGANTDTYTTASLTATLYYRVQIRQSPSGCETFSDAVPVIVATITTQPIPTTICIGGIVNLNITASLNGGTGTLSYQWQNSANGTSGWTNVTDGTGATTNSYTSGALSVNTFYRCVVTSSTTNCTIISNVAQATVVPDPTITVQPTGTTICSGGNYTLAVTATNGTPSLNYQWFSSTDNNTFTSISGATSSTYNTPALTQTTYYRVDVSATGNGCTTITSSVAIIIVLSDISITTQPVQRTNICSGSTATLNVTVSGGSGNYNYQWKNAIVLTGPYTNIPGAISASYTTPALSQNNYYQVVISDGTQGCDPVTSNISAVIIPTITTQPLVPATVCTGGTVSLTTAASANGGSATFSYQWQSSSDGSTGWTNVTAGSGGTTPNYSSGPLTATTYFRALITSATPACTLITNVVSAVVIPDPTIATQPTGGNICEGGTFTMTSGAADGSGNYTYQWQESLNGTSGWANVTNGSGANTPTYTTGIVTADTFYRLQVTDSGMGCGVINSSAAKVDVFESPIITLQPLDDEVCTNQTHTFTVTAFGNIPSGTLLYQWQTALVLAGPYSNVTDGTGGTTASYTTPVYTTAGNRYFRVVISQLQAGCETASNQVTLNVFDIPAAPVGSVIQQPSCTNATGIISITNPDLGTGYEYSIDGITFQASNIFAGLPPGNETIYVRRIGLNTCISGGTTFTIFNRVCAVPETFASISGDLGGNTGTQTILDSDTINGVIVNTSDITVTINSISSYLTFDPLTNTISVAPATPADDYTLTYTICETANPSNCSTTTEIINVTTAGIDARIDIVPFIVNGYVDNFNVINALTNDRLASLPVTVSNVQISLVNPALPIDPLVTTVPVLDIATGNVDVPAGTVKGLYEIRYRICEIASPSNCDTASILIQVGTTIIDANDDWVENINGFIGQVNAVNALTNDTLNGTAITSANFDEIIITQELPATPLYPGANVPILSPATGWVSVPAETPADTYYITYHICEKLNPSNCSDASIAIVVDPAPIVANDDVINNVNGYEGAANIINAYTGNDTFNGIAVNITLVGLITPTILIPAAPINGGPVPELIVASGRVNIPAGTPAGQYQIKYQLCENLNPGHCDDAIITINVTAPEIIATDDAVANVNSYSGAADILNAYDNDTLNGGTLDLSTITTTVISVPGAINGGPVPSFDIATGLVSVPPKTPAGEYKFVYQICESLNTGNCDQATITITVVSAPIIAENDVPFAPVNGFAGNPNVINALDNDTLDGIPVLLSEVQTDVLIPATSINGSPIPVLNPLTGNVSVPAGTAAGNYFITYRLSEKLNLTNNDTAIITIEVTAPLIQANDDTVANINGYVTTVNAINVLANDTLNGIAASLNDINITVDTPAASINGGSVPVLQPLTGMVSVPAGTPAGDYEITYHICEKLNPANCNDATVYVTVAGPPILAVNDNVAGINGYKGETNVINAITNDLLNGTPVQLAQINITSISTATPADYVSGNPVPVLNTTTGIVDVPAETSSGTYTIHYSICEKLNPANCSEADIVIQVIAATIIANNDIDLNVNGYTGSSNAFNVLDNDSFDDSSIESKTAKIKAINISQITITILNPANSVNGNPNVPVLDTATGIISVPPQTPAGLYTIQYRISENLNPSNFDDATVFITVTAAVIEANSDTVLNVNGFNGQADVINAITNDNLNGVAAQLAEITIGAVTPATPINAGPVPTLDIVTGNLNVPAGTPSGTYTIRYEICEKLNPANCSQADIIVTVISGPIIANDDSASGINGLDGAVNVVNVLTNDLLDNAAPALSQITINVVSPADAISGGAVPNLNTSTGLVSVPAGTSSGIYTIVYQICENLNATNCDQAVIKLTVVQPEITLVKRGVFSDTNGDGYAQPGELIRYIFLIANTGSIDLNNVTVTDPKAVISGTPVATLIAGHVNTTNYTATYVLTQADINSGFVVNQALVTAQPTSGTAIQDLSDSDDPTLTGDDDPTVTPVIQFKDLTLIKGGQLTGTGGVGSVINYNFTVRNTGNVTLSNVEITDPMLTATSIVVTPSTLAPGENGTAIASYTVNAADVVSGEVINTALAIGDDPQGNSVIDVSDSTDPVLTGDDDPTVVDLTLNPSIALIKTAVFNDENKNGYAEIGETVTYNFALTNTGNIVLVNVVVKDPKPGITISGGPIILSQGETNSTIFKGTYVLTAADIEAGFVENQAEAEAVTLDELTATDLSDDNSNLENDPTILPLNVCKVIIYNAVSPNGDGINEIFKIDGIECYPQAYVQIYDRWGVLVYDAYGYDNESIAFKGISEGRATVNRQKRLPNGTYFYVITYITYLNEPVSQTGYLYLSGN